MNMRKSLLALVACGCVMASGSLLMGMQQDSLTVAIQYGSVQGVQQAINEGAQVTNDHIVLAEGLEAQGQIHGIARMLRWYQSNQQMVVPSGFKPQPVEKEDPLAEY